MGAVYNVRLPVLTPCLFIDKNFQFSFAIWFGCYIGKHKDRQMLHICQVARWSFPIWDRKSCILWVSSIGAKRERDSGLFIDSIRKKQCFEFLEFKNKRRENRYGDELENLNTEKDPQPVNGLLLYWLTLCCIGQYGSLDQKYQHQNSGNKAQQTVFTSPQMILMPPTKVAPSAMGMKLVLKNISFGAIM